MFGPAKQLADLPFYGQLDEYWGRLPHDLLLEDVANETLAAHKLDRQPDEFIGEYLAIPYVSVDPAGSPTDAVVIRTSIRRTRLSSFAHPKELLAAIRAHVKAIAEHGPGRVWFLMAPVHFLRRDGDVAPLAGIIRREVACVDDADARVAQLQREAMDGDREAEAVLGDLWEERGRIDLARIWRREPHLALRTMYGHEAQATPNVIRSTMASVAPMFRKAYDSDADGIEIRIRSYANLIAPAASALIDFDED